MNAFRSSLFACTVAGAVAACAAGAPAAHDNTAPSSSPAAALVSAPVTAGSAAPAPSETPPPAAGYERRYLRVGKSGVPVSIDVPSSWSTALDPKDASASFKPCHLEAPVFGDLQVFTLACSSDGDLEACMARQEAAHLADAKHDKVGKQREWTISDGPDKQGQRRIDAALFVGDEASREVVRCQALGLRGEDLALFEKYKAACDSLVLRPASMQALATAKPAQPRPDDGDAPRAPRDKAIVDAAVDFLAAAARHDERGVRARLAGSWLCDAEPEGRRARCQKGFSQMGAAIPKLLDAMAAKWNGARFEGGSVELRAQDRLTWVTVHPKGDECGDGATVAVAEHAGKFFVVPGMRKDD